MAVAAFKKYDSEAEAKRNIIAAIDNVAKQLGNTRAICRKCYIQPTIIEAYMAGDLAQMAEAKIAERFKHQFSKLTADEVMVLSFLPSALSP